MINLREKPSMRKNQHTLERSIFFTKICTLRSENYYYTGSIEFFTNLLILIQNKTLSFLYYLQKSKRNSWFEKYNFSISSRLPFSIFVRVKYRCARELSQNVLTILISLSLPRSSRNYRETERARSPRSPWTVHKSAANCSCTLVRRREPRNRARWCATCVSRGYVPGVMVAGW